MLSKDERRDAIAKFKETKSPIGIYSVRFQTGGQTWVGSSRNLTATKNSLLFGLKIGSHRDHSLQSAWNAAGESAIEYTILEVLDEETPSLNVGDALKARKQHWLNQLTARELL